MVSIGLAVVVADQITKHWAVTSLPGRPPVPVFWTLQWNLSFNTGMAFSRGQSVGPIIAAVAMVVVVAVAQAIRKTGHPWAMTSGALIIGGAIGNLIDRVFRNRAWLRGGVVDFIDFQWFPIFNVADSAITIGGLMFVLWSLSGRRVTESPAIEQDAS
jgi:signal peptidase II